MKKELLELVRERLIKIEDNKQQVDILQYFVDIEFFMAKVNEYKWLSSRVPEKYHHLSVRDFIDLSNNQLEELSKDSFESFPDTICGIIGLKELYSIKQYNFTLENGCKIIDGAFGCSNTGVQKGECDIFAEHILKNMNKNDQLFDAGIALFHDDEDIQKASKQYKISRN